MGVVLVVLTAHSSAFRLSQRSVSRLSAQTLRSESSPLMMSLDDSSDSQQGKEDAATAGYSYSAAARSISRNFARPSVQGKTGKSSLSRSKFALSGVLDDVKKIISGGDPTEALTVENDALVKEYMLTVEEINKLEDSYEALSDDELTAKTAGFKERLAAGQSLDSLLVEAFAGTSP